MGWEESLKSYKNYLSLEKSLTRNSIIAYLTDVNKLEHFLLEEFKEIPPGKVELIHLKAFLEHLNDEKISPRSQARIISGIKSFFNFLIVDGKIEKNPSALLEAPKIGVKLPDVLSIEEIDALINVIDLTKAEGQRNRAMLETLYSCGLRVSELIGLKITNLYFEQGYIKVEGKGGKQRLVPVSNRAINEINSYMENGRSDLDISPDSQNILFLNRRGKKLTRVMVFTIIKKLAQQIGLKKKISPHTFRHSFATHLIDGGADLRVVQEMLGHESILTTEIYTHLDREYLRDTINRYHPRS